MNYTKAKVKATACSRRTGAAYGRPRTEIVSLETNALFLGCETPLQVKAAYEAFWNELNPHSMDIVLVSSVVMVK